jgi:glucose/arabinose dehydrogenase
MKKRKIIISVVIPLVLVAAVAFLLFYFYKNFRGSIAAFASPPQRINEINDLPLETHDGFSISVFADEVPRARVLASDIYGNLWVSQTRQGQITRIAIEDGKLIKKQTVLKNLKNPHGIAFDPENPSVLYIAEEDRISYFDTESTEPELIKIIDLPEGDRHYTRTIDFGPGGKLYVSIGSTCDVCIEKDERHASIYHMDKDGSDFRKFADGLRNSVFFKWHPLTDEMWATEMGRDFLGDELPPDELNVIKRGGFYGWPYCYGNKLLDESFEKSSAAINFCKDSIGSYIDIPAHSAPLGLDFFPGKGWPEEYRYDLLVAYHGSWNRTEPTGYKVVRYLLEEDGSYKGVEDFITGWLNENESSGRPVDIKIGENGTIYISDDKAGVIYKVEYHAGST